MLTVRKANKKDKPVIIQIIKNLDLSYPSQAFNNFWVVEEIGRIVGIANLEEFKDFMFLSSLGVPENLQGRGIATKLLDEILKDTPKDIYLYTTTPEFFKKFGFQVTVPISGLPSKQTYFCRDCTPETCKCMVKLASVHRISQI